MQRQHGRLQAEDHQQQHASGTGQHGLCLRQLGDLGRHVSNIQGAQGAVQHAQCEQEQAGAYQVERHIVEAGLGLLLATAVNQQGIGGNQQHLEEHEQVEDVPGQEGTVDAHQLEQNQRVEVGTGSIFAGTGIEQRGQTQHRGQQNQQR